MLNNPVMLKDPTGLIVMVCTRKIHGPLARLGANHQYLFQPPNLTCGSLDGPPETPANDYCVPIPGSPGKEPGIMRCCRREVEISRYSGGPTHKPYAPYLNDCFNVVNRCLRGAGLRGPDGPGRFGPPCGKCDPGPDAPLPSP